MLSDAFISFLPSADLEASRRFYSDVLGLELAVDQGTCLIYRTAPSAFVGVCERSDDNLGRGVITTFVTDDVDGWCARIVANGGTINSGPEQSGTYDIYHAFLADPDGNTLEIQRFNDPDWAKPTA